MISVNQLAASIKLTEVWKSINMNYYPIQLEPESDRIVRTTTSRLWNQDARSRSEKESFSRNTAKIWNAAPMAIKNAKTLATAKNEIKKYVKLVPIHSNAELRTGWLIQMFKFKFK